MSPGNRIGNLMARSGPMTREAEGGFTLVEFAVALVIIGLLIGAILQGQALIMNTRVKSTLALVEEIRRASELFRDRYFDYPGDFATATASINTTSTLTNGDGDGEIDGTGIAGETLNFWSHLAAAEIITHVRVNGAAKFGDGLPRSSLGGGLTVRRETVDDRNAHWLTLGTAAETATGVVGGQTAFQLDQKIDDGNPRQGRVHTTTAACGGGTDDYAVGGTVINCVVKFQL